MRWLCTFLITLLLSTCILAIPFLPPYSLHAAAQYSDRSSDWGLDVLGINRASRAWLGLLAPAGTSQPLGPGAESASHDSSTDDQLPFGWRHTNQGWERIELWQLAPPRPSWMLSAASCHPALVAMMQLLLSLAALMTFPAQIERAAPRTG